MVHRRYGITDRVRPLWCYYSFSILGSSYRGFAYTSLPTLFFHSEFLDSCGCSYCAIFWICFSGITFCACPRVSFSFFVCGIYKLSSWPDSLRKPAFWYKLRKLLKNILKRLQTYCSAWSLNSYAQHKWRKQWKCYLQKVKSKSF